MERRTFLRWVAGIPLLAIVVRGDVSDYTDSSRVLEDLAEGIDQADLMDADEIFNLSNSVRRALQDAEAGIRTSKTDRARTVASFRHFIAEILAIIPGVDSPPEEPPIERKIDAIESALSYYRTLQTFLHHSGDLYIDISRFEADVSDPTSEPTLVDDDLISLADDSVVRIKSEGERLQEADGSPVQSLLPDTERVADLSGELMENYEIYAIAQRSYSNTTEYIRQGARLREQEDFGDAEVHFHHAENQPSIAIPESNRDHSVDGELLTLSEYETVLSLTKSGAHKMWDSCDNPDSKQSRDSFSEGLQDVIDARDVFTTL